MSRRERDAETPLTTSSAVATPGGPEDDDVIPSPDDIVKFNVGGRRFETTAASLRRVSPEPGAKRNNYFTGVLSGRIRCVRDAKGYIFIDRDPTLFEYVLEWLRTGNFHVPAHIHMDAIYKEAAHYGVLLPRGKIFEKESEYHTEVVTLKNSTLRDEALQRIINAKETEGYTFIQCAVTKDTTILFFKTS
ncbi:hypothetical protein Pelo_13170 [Pelomyxa schiedti]|nr:hypothetical protein Pelo_13170 [Pelomyxa schiedti]